jgi:3-dehydrotetronate 4-kinase
VGLIDYATVGAGPEAIATRVAALRDEGVGIAVVDAICNDDLMRLGRALAGMPLVTAGSGVAIGLAQNWGIEPSPRAAQLPRAAGLRAAVSGSCSVATLAQVAQFGRAGFPAHAIDPLAMAEGRDAAADALAWAVPRLASGPVLVYSTATPNAVRAVQERLGIARAGEMVEAALASVAKGLVEAGVRQLVVAGGETSGAVVQALGIAQLAIGPQIDPGVPWCAAQAHAAGGTMHIALKSGNFGAPDFFAKAFAALA